MVIEHIALWTENLELLKDYYTRYFQGIPGPGYHNPLKQFRSCFISFGSGARMELMSGRDIPENLNDTAGSQHTGWIHVAFAVESREEVDRKAVELRENGFRIIDGPRVTGDGYYEFTTLDPDNNRLEVTTKA